MVFSCHEDPVATAPSGEVTSGAVTTDLDRLPSMDEEFLRIAAKAPEFGGAFADDDVLQVVVTDTTAFERVAGVLAPGIRFGKRLERS